MKYRENPAKGSGLGQQKLVHFIEVTGTLRKTG